MKLYIPCRSVSGIRKVLAVTAPPGVRVLSFTNHHRAIEAGNAIRKKSWILCNHEHDYTTHEATGEGKTSVWETELDELAEAGMAVGPDGFGMDLCVFNKLTMMVTVVESMDVQVEFDMDSVRVRLDALAAMY